MLVRRKCTVSTLVLSDTVPGLWLPRADLSNLPDPPDLPDLPTICTRGAALNHLPQYAVRKAQRQSTTNASESKRLLNPDNTNLVRDLHAIA